MECAEFMLIGGRGLFRYYGKDPFLVPDDDITSSVS